ncbi:DUF7668 domain-containing protein [Luteimonas lutimaris]|uniref:DUF7668 domain-containing protein n=1 Tax=Luteimonas lutimaris TaxID=698645 RepID=A0ABP7M7Z0_9GAMM
MSQQSPSDEVQRPIPTTWRHMFREIVAALVAADYRLEAQIPGVEPVSIETATQIRDYLSEYGATLVELPEATWESSVCIWTGSHWDVIVDLWTQEEGRSDLILHAQVVETQSGISVTVHLVYVP